ncbi:MAG: hypothetical protein HY868_15805 [Chloroflexi bacterium]|nr:hypothetical protein [Chloroflexota bacterium]
MSSTTFDRKRILILAGGAGCVLAFLAVLVIGGGFFAWNAIFVAATPTARAVAISTPTRVAIVATTPTALPTRTPIVEYQIYASKVAFFSVQYPRGWTVNDQEQAKAMVTFTAPDRSAQQSVSFGAAGSQTAEQALNVFLTDRFRAQAPDVRVLSQRAASDGSALADIEYTSADLGGRVRGVLRVVVVSGGFYYAVLFSAKGDQLDRATAEKFVDGLSIGK